MKYLNDNKNTSVATTTGASIRTYRAMVFPGVPFQPTALSDFCSSRVNLREWDMARSNMKNGEDRLWWKDGEVVDSFNGEKQCLQSEPY